GDKNVVLVLKEAEVVLPLAEMVDLDVERKRLEKEMAVLRSQSERLERQLADEAFLTRAPADLVAKEREKLAGYRDKLARLEKQLAGLEKT
ncbi:MAG: valyl-tRNA synthetase, partial [Dehalococcoidia bacterium]|nr:valyl-tRNA synthetase [Dehalococcoidia bacterium]